MKKVLVFIALFSVLLLNSCSKDNAVAPVTYKNVEITNISINLLPMVNANGNAWDLLSGPDVYIKIYDYASNPILTKSTVKNDVSTAMFPLNWGLTDFTSTVQNGKYFFEIYDEDTTTDEKMANGVFQASDYPTYPATATLTNTNGTLKITLTLKWSN